MRCYIVSGIKNSDKAEFGTEEFASFYRLITDCCRQMITFMLTFTELWKSPRLARWEFPFNCIRATFKYRSWPLTTHYNNSAKYCLGGLCYWIFWYALFSVQTITPYLSVYGIQEGVLFLLSKIIFHFIFYQFACFIPSQCFVVHRLNNVNVY